MTTGLLRKRNRPRLVASVSSLDQSTVPQVVAKDGSEEHSVDVDLHGIGQGQELVVCRVEHCMGVSRRRPDDGV